MWRPAYKITASNPGTDVCAITAGAMAAGARAFRNKGETLTSKYNRQNIAYVELWRGIVCYPIKICTNNRKNYKCIDS